ncbi:recombinase zinc beta ribbon domain-containing protein [Roseovarius rhodophyticola]|uniref:Recombinase zinc beta ribbon domain-containing protein n=1 Tax=Roseovarius rhodophyticola TaxID=3080827 RepID=A0ABZ2TL16_9RHOB|nr:recombinase zinc beta ribbon domain-containing protein [Roseovarius sp. W115]MDV2930168.1 recombinase zinc beta ribbon domain-containing protein [Roseovarius sp. W115]
MFVPCFDQRAQSAWLSKSGGKPISKGCLENLLANPFYYGTIRMKRSGKLFNGIHTPIIDKSLFDRVQEVKTGKHNRKVSLHNHTYRRLVVCGCCDRTLYGEQQKGQVYMRCHTKGCPTTTIREDRLEGAISRQLLELELGRHDRKRLERELQVLLTRRNTASDRRALQLQLSNLDRRKEQLTDALLDGLIDKSAFQERRVRLENEKQDLSDALRNIDDTDGDEQLARNFLELVKNVCLTYQISNKQQKRRLTEILFSNRTLTGKNLYLEPQKWLSNKLWAISVLCGPPDRDTARTKEHIQNVLNEFHEWPRQ